MEYKIFQFDNTAIVFAEVQGVTVMTVVPSDMTGKIVPEKMSGVDPFGNERAESAVQVAVGGDVLPRGFAAGRTLRNGELSLRWGAPAFDYCDGESEVTLTVTYRTEEGLINRQYFRSIKGTGVIETCAETENKTAGEVVLESAPSFLLTRLSPFVKYNDEAEILIHKMRNYWSGEGILDTASPDRYALEDSWSGLGIRLEKIGQVGSMPANGYLPWVAVEDRTNHCTWAVNLEAPASWQIEIANVNNALSLCGGLADFNYGHWEKKLNVGESFRTKKAYLVCCKGTLDRAHQALVGYAQKTQKFLPAEEELPVLYNEYCYSWGKPDFETVKKLLPVCKSLGVSYFVVDAGWYRTQGNWEAVGDWDVNYERFPNGLKAYADLCEEYGMRAGIWMEFESASVTSALAKEHPDWLLTYKGKTILHGDRCMLDLRKQEVQAHLHEKVTKMLLDSGIRYIKIDYNENIGLGADGAESLGEGLRLQAEAAQEFFRSLKRDVPDLVIEICSSGGMRHEASWLACGDMCSFSDAHEGPEGAVIACNLHRFMPPRKMQIWATIRSDYGYHETVFTLVKSMLGRMCLSGKIFEREESVLAAIRDGVTFYREIKDIVRDGETVNITTEDIKGYRNIHGIQTLDRISSDGKRMLRYLFMIGKPRATKELMLPKGYLVQKSFGNIALSEKRGKLIAAAADTDMAGVVMLLERDE